MLSPYRLSDSQTGSDQAGRQTAPYSDRLSQFQGGTVPANKFCQPTAVALEQYACRMQPPIPELLTGDESIVGTDASVRDFWAWSMSNLRTNTIRSLLGEYLVAKAVNALSTQRIEWDSFDVKIRSEE